MPDDFGVTIACSDVLDDGIVFVFYPGSASVVTVCDALGERFFHLCVSTCGGVEGDQDVFLSSLEAGGVVPIDNG